MSNNWRCDRSSDRIRILLRLSNLLEHPLIQGVVIIAIQLANFNAFTASPAIAQHGSQEQCAAQANSNARISRDQLRTFLILRVTAPWESVNEIMGAPYCWLRIVDAADGNGYFQRAAYPMAFDDDGNWLIVFRDPQGRYAGYDFAFVGARSRSYKSIANAPVELKFDQ